MSNQQREQYGTINAEKVLNGLYKEIKKENWFVRNKKLDRMRELKELKKYPQWGVEVPSLGGDILEMLNPLGGIVLRDIEGLYLLYEGMANSKTQYSMMCVFALWVRDNIEDSLCSSVLKYMQGLVNEVGSVMGAQSTTEDMHKGLPPWIRMMHDAASDWKLFTQNPLFAHLSKFLGLIVSIGICKSEQLTFHLGNFRMLEPYIFTIHHDAKDVITAILDSATFFAETLYKCYLDRSFKPLLTSKSEMDTLDGNYMELKSLWDYARNGNLYKFKSMEDTEFALLLDSTIKGFKSVAPSLHKLERRMVDMKIFDLSQIQKDFILHKKGAGLRRRPFALEVVGESAAGKSTFLSQLLDMLLASQNLDLDLSRRYSKTSNDQYLSGWMTSHLTLTMDDFGNELTKANGETSEIGRMVIDVVNNQVYIPNMAELEQKGSLFVEPEIFAITTNVKDLHATRLSACPVSIQGRMNYVVNIAPVSKFRKMSEQGVAIGIDYQKVQESLRDDPPKTPFDDRVWKVTIQEVVIEDSAAGIGQLGSYKNVKDSSGRELVNITFLEAANFLIEQFDYHRKKQRQIVDAANACKENLTLCGIDGCRQIKHACMRHCAPIRKENLDAIHNDVPIAIASDGLVGRNHAPNRVNQRLMNHFSKKGLQPHSIVEQAVMSTKDALADIARDVCRDTLRNYMFVPLLLQPFFKRLVYKWLKFVMDDAIFTFLPSCLFRTRVVKQLVFSSRLRMWKRTFGFSFLVGIVLCVFWTYGVTHNILHTFLACLMCLSVLLLCVLHLYMTTENYIAARFNRVHVRLSSVIAERRAREIQWCLQTVPIIMVVVQVVRTVLTMKRQQGNLEPKCMADIEVRDQEKTIWTDVSVRKLPLSSVNNSTTTENLLKLLQKNLVYLSITMNNKKWMANGLMLTTNVIMIPEHYIQEDEFWIDAYKEKPEQAAGSFRAKLSVGMSVKIPNCDMRVFYVPSGGSFRNIIKHFPDDYIGNVPFRMMWRQKDGLMRLWTGYSSSIKDITTVSTFKGFEYKRLSGNTFGGMCGAPVVSDTGRACVIGIHLGGREDTPIGASGVFRRDQLETCVAELDRKVGVRVSSGDAHFPGTCFGLTTAITELEPHAKSPVRYLPHGSQIAYHGSYPNRATSVTRVIDTCISPSIAYICGVPNIYGGPKMKPEWYGYQKALENMSLVGTTFSPRLLQRSIHCYISSLVPLVSKGGTFHGMRPLTYHENLNGISGKRFIDAMKFDTAVGFPATGPKSEYLENHTPGERVFVPEVNKEIERMEERYINGERAYPIIKACKKDEVLAKRDKCRIFWSNPVQLTYMVRKYFLPLCRLLQMNPLLSECAVGINAISDEWDQMYNFVITHGKERIIAGDYSKYDQKMPTQMIVAAFDILIELATISGYSEKDIKVMSNLITDVVYPIVAMNGDYISFTQGSHISGNSLTVVINGIVGALQWRMAFYDLYPNEEFRENVALITYGDDNIGSVSEKCSGFNIKSIQRFLEQHNQVYTMPDKDSELTEFIPEEEVVFLQRFSVRMPCGVLVGALSEASIFKRLHCMVYKSSSGLSKKEMAAMNIDTSLLDWFFHGRDTYEFRRMQMREVAMENELEHMCTNLDKSYEDWLGWWEDSYKLPKSDSELKSQKLAPFNLWGPGGKLTNCLHYWLPFFSHEESQWGIEEALCRRDSERRSVFTEDARSRSDHASWYGDMQERLNFATETKLNKQSSIESPVDAGRLLSQMGSNSDRSLYTRHDSVEGPYDFPDGLRKDLTFVKSILTNVSSNVLVTGYLRSPERVELCRMVEIAEDLLELLLRRVETIEHESQIFPQSGQETNGMKGASVETPENVTFSDADGGFATMINGIMDNSRYIRDDPDTSFRDDLHRVRRVETILWQYGNGSQGSYVSVWENLINDQFILDRLTGHKLFRGTLCIKATVNGNAMFHGLAQLCYRYFPNNLDEPGPIPTIGRGRSCIISQLPRILINPTTSTGGTMKIPFHFHKDYLDLTTDDYKNMGELEFDVLGELRHAQGAVENLPIQIYAWFEDTYVSGLTETDVFPQSGREDEVDEANKGGHIDVPSTALGVVKRAIENVPMLPGLLRATAKGARMYSNAASLLGYSRPAITAEPMRYVVTPGGQLAATTVPSASEKLSVDDKQELTISPTVGGASAHDPYDILSIASRDSFFFSPVWLGTDVVGTRIMHMKVNPLYILRRTDDPTGMAFTAMAAAAFPFDYWTGSINFRFTVAASGLHKGRLRIVYDPTGRTDAPVDDQMARSVVQVVDIAEEPDFVVSVKNQQARGWLRTASADEDTDRSWGTDIIQGSAPFTVNPLSSVHNGTLAVYVENTLTTVNPANIPAVNIIVHVSAGDDFEVASPNNRLSQLTPYKANSNIPAQSGVENDKGAAMNHTEIGQPDRKDTTYDVGQLVNIPDRNLVYMGETIKSFRPLLKRFTFTHARALNGENDNQLGFCRYLLPGLGVMPGEHAFARDTFNSVPQVPYSFSNMTFFQYLNLMHAGFRGGVRWKLALVPNTGGNGAYLLTCDRRAYPFGQNIDNVDAVSVLTQSLNVGGILGSSNSIIPSMHAGGAMTNDNNGVLNIEVPFQSFHRFVPGKRIIYEYTSECDPVVEVNYGGLLRTPNNTGPVLMCYAAAAEDYTNFFYTGLPYMRLKQIFL